MCPTLIYSKSTDRHSYRESTQAWSRRKRQRLKSGARIGHARDRKVGLAQYLILSPYSERGSLVNVPLCSHRTRWDRRAFPAPASDFQYESYFDDLL